MKHHPTFSTANQLARNVIAPNYLIKGILEQDAHGVIFGASMSYKSFTVLELAHCIVNGRDFMGHKVKKQGTVIYICGEGSSGISRRLKAQIITNGEFHNDGFLLLNESISIDDTQQMAQLKSAIAEIKPALVIFDTFASLVSNTNENDNSEVARVLNLIRNTCRNEYGTSSIIVHHTGKDDSKGMRGASAFKNNVDFSFELKRAGDTNTVLSCEKMKDGEPFKDIYMAAKVVDLKIVDEDGETLTSLVMSQSEGSKRDFKTTKILNKNESNVLTAIHAAIAQQGETPPQHVVEKFKDSPQHLPQQVVSVDLLRRFAYPYLIVSDNSKRTVMARALTNLESAYKIGYYDGYLWLIL